MPPTALTREQFHQHKQGRTFADVVNDAGTPFDDVLGFFSDSSRQRRMEEAELHHDRPPLAGVVREFESQEKISRFLRTAHPRRTQRLRQAVGVVVRIVMERRGWRKTGRKGSLGVRTNVKPGSPVPGSHHNTGGLALWFLRAERYELVAGMPYQTVREQSRQLKLSQLAPVANPAGSPESSDLAGSSPRRTRANGTPLSKKNRK
jgi:hypothetical protein